MKDITDIIKRNLFFKVDFDGKYKKGKDGITQEVRFFLIGVLPIVVEYNNKKSERAVLNIPLEVKQDPYLRMLHGARFKFIPKIQKEIKAKFKIKVSYKKEADEIVDSTRKAVQKVMRKKEFMGKKIKSIMIINIDKGEYEQKKQSKNSK